MDKNFNHALSEHDIYKLWEDKQAFNPDTTKSKTGKTFTIIMPPPNANDPLHIGHAMFVSIEDVLIRYHRMLGDDTLWLPGTDHAGIETQFVFEKKLKKQGKSRFNFDKKTLYQMIWEYVQENSSIAVDQIKKLGASADWSRFKFMLDEDVVKEVLSTFKDLHNSKDEDGNNLIYRDLRLVNFCTKCGTSYSELEVDHHEKLDPLYTIKYGPLEVSTVRPETIFGDVALAVNPQDDRYKSWVGKTINASFPWGDVGVRVIADDYVKIDFGTGVLKITPYHDPNDWDVWQRHLNDLPQPKQVIDKSGKMQNVPEKYSGLNIEQARKAVVEDLQKNNLIVDIKDTPHSVGSCYRCGKTIEPLPLPQFFIRVKSLTKPILESLKKHELIVYGAGHDKILKHWLENLKDWNISRQITWGIPIPVWYKISGYEDKIEVGFLSTTGQFLQGKLSDLLKIYSLMEIKTGLQQVFAESGVPYSISETTPTNADNYIQETDTFDTWFSSSQWPFTTLKHTKEGDFDRFYPTQVMETGYDILPFWVMRMLMMGKFKTNKLPFSKVYLHGLVRDQKGQKMSKSKGNVINPLEITEKYGADALRMALVIRSSAGLDKSVGEGDFKAMRNLSNKIWNSARYLILNLEQNNSGGLDINNPQIEDEKFHQKIKQIKKEISKNIDNFQLGLASEKLHNEFWHWYCDEAIEKGKNGLISQKALLDGLVIFLKLFHPFMPFVTETIWQELRKKGLVEDELLIRSNW